MRRRALTAVAGVLVLSACGGNLAMTDGIRTDAVRQLQSDVLSLTQAAAAHNWPAARTALKTLRADVDASLSAGAITSARAAAIDASAAQVAGQLPALATPAPSLSSTAPAPVATTRTNDAPQPPAPAPKPHKHHDSGD